MTGQFYDNPERRFYSAENFDAATGSDLFNIVGPAGKVGRIRSFDGSVTVVLGAGDVVVTVDTVTPSVSPVPTLTLLATSAAGVIARATKASLDLTADLAADTVYQVAQDGGSASGDATVNIAIDWY